MLFSQTIDNIDSEISELLAQVETKKQKQTQLIELDALTDNTLEGLADVVSKIGHYAPDAIASLKSAVLTLFDNGSGNDGGNQPDEPTPGSDDKPDSGETILTDATSVDESDEIEEVDFIDEDCLEYPTLEGQCCHIEQELEFYWQRLAKPEGQAWDFASPIACLVWEDAPMLGQCCTVEYPLPEVEKPTYTEFVKVSDRIGYIKVNITGEIKATYVGFNNKARAKSWANYLEALTPNIELRAAKRLGDWKHELKIRGLSAQQIERLTTEDFSKSFKADKPQAVQSDEFEPGDIVVQSLTPSASFRIEAILPNGVLDCTDLTTGERLGLRPSAVQLVQKASTETPYLVTSGNYTGLAKQTRQRWEKLGIDPKDLIAEMKAKRPPEPEWNAAKYNPIQRELAATGADDASDF